eukprot:scaffold3498_cov66-Skeletonema_marinoi.AAC.1
MTRQTSAYWGKAKCALLALTTVGWRLLYKMWCHNCRSGSQELLGAGCPREKSSEFCNIRNKHMKHHQVLVQAMINNDKHCNLTSSKREHYDR